MRCVLRARTSLALAAALTFALAAPALAQAAYGAIAVNPSSGQFGLSYRVPARWYAERQAVRKCPAECTVMVWVYDRCAAVVIGKARFVAGMGESKLAAIRVARQRAHDRRAPLVAWTCSG